MEQEHRRIKRAEVSDETRRGRRRASVNPNAHKVDNTGRVHESRANRRDTDDGRRGGASR